MDRGFGRCMVTKKFTAHINKYSNGTVDESRSPSEPETFQDGSKNTRYKRQQHLDHDGFVKVGEVVDSGALLVNKFSPINVNSTASTDTVFPVANSNQEYKPAPLSYKGAAEAVVDKVMVTSTENETILVKVSIFVKYIYFLKRS